MEVAEKYLLFATDDAPSRNPHLHLLDGQFRLLDGAIGRPGLRDGRVLLVGCEPDELVFPVHPADAVAAKTSSTTSCACCCTPEAPG